MDMVPGKALLHIDEYGYRIVGLLTPLHKTQRIPQCYPSWFRSGLVSPTFLYFPRLPCTVSIRPSDMLRRIACSLTS